MDTRDPFENIPLCATKCRSLQILDSGTFHTEISNIEKTKARIRIANPTDKKKGGGEKVENSGRRGTLSYLSDAGVTLDRHTDDN